MPEPKPFDLEAVYDEKINPLMKQIIAICNEHRLPMFATFAYRFEDDETGFCTTILNAFGGRKIGELDDAFREVKRGPSMVAITITSAPKEKT